MYYHYVELKESTITIGDICGVSNTTIRTWLRKHKIQIRSAWNGECYTEDSRNRLSTSMKQHFSTEKGMKQKQEYSERMSGPGHYGWKGGRISNGEGYILIKLKHPFSSKRNYIMEHRLVMERYLREDKPNHPALIEIDEELYLRPEWVVHHENEIKDDNRIENLKPFENNVKHKEYHEEKRKREKVENKSN